MGSKAKQYDWLDQIKGGLIVLVVLGHITLVNETPNWYRFQHVMLDMFHMPLFFAASGFLFGAREWENDPKEIIGKKLVSLGIPYILFEILYIFINYLVQDYVQTNTRVKLSAITEMLWAPVAQYWFLWSLILFFVVAAVTKANKKLWIAGIALAVFIFLFLTAWQRRIGFYLFFSGG